MLHLLPTVNVLKLVFTGADLNKEHLPLEVISRIRPCRACRQNCRAVKFDFQSRTLYHTYARSSAFSKPNLICFFNPGLYRTTAADGEDAWPETITAAVAQNCPIVVTSYTEMEAPLDFERLITICDHVKIVQMPAKNPFKAVKPERNFMSEEVQPLMFKNYYYFIVQ